MIKVNFNIIKTAGIFIAGALVGGGLTYKILKEKAEEMVDEEVEAMRQYYINKYESKAIPKDRAEKKVRLKDVSQKEKGEVKSNITYEKKARDYTKYAKVSEKEETEAALEVQKAEEPDHDYPYIISVEEYSETADHFDKITLTYYVDDDTLTEHDDPIPDVSMTVGDEALTSFGEKSDDADIVYVRNENIATDFEIVRSYKSYREAVLGIVDKPAKKARTKKPVSDDE